MRQPPTVSLKSFAWFNNNLLIARCYNPLSTKAKVVDLSRCVFVSSSSLRRIMETGKDPVNSTTGQRQVHDGSTTGPRRIHDRSTTGPRRVHDRSTTGPRRVHDRSTMGPRRVHDGSTTNRRIMCSGSRHDNIFSIFVTIIPVASHRRRVV